MIIVFEGPDGAGKTTLFKAVAQLRGYKDTYIDRMFISDIVYALKRNDISTVEEKKEQLIKFNESFSPFHIYVKAQIEDQRTALISKGEAVDVANMNWQDISYDSVFHTLLSGYGRRIIVHRTGKSIQRCAIEIVKAIKEIKWREDAAIDK